MKTRVLIDSTLSPADVLQALTGRNRDWRESDIPEDLRRFGVLGFHVRTKGNTFYMRMVQPQLDNIEWIYCNGLVRATSQGCRIEAFLRRAGVGPVLLPLIWLLAAWQALRTHSVSGLVVAAVFSGLVLGLRGIVYLANDTRAEVEHRAFITILRRAAIGDASPLTSRGVAV